MGGVLGARKTTKNFAELRDELGRACDAVGVLVTHSDPDAQ
jgi:hypothetical protein